jgi:hypothetical protein
VLPPIDPTTGLLPEAPDPHRATLDEVYLAFVTAAPFPERRELIFNALSLYARLIWAIYPDARLRIDGGFVTHKTWAEPEDIDVAVVCPTITPAQRDAATEAGLFSIGGAQGVVHRRKVGPIQKLHPMGGLVDAFYVPEKDVPYREFFEDYWSTETGPNKQPTGRRKGYVEVVNPDAP